jgi:hypothetical protein
MYRRKWTKSFFRVMLALASSAWASAVVAGGEPAGAGAVAPAWEELLTWLPADTETICVVQKPFTIQDRSKPDGREPYSESAQLIQTLFKGPFGITERSAGLYRSLFRQKVLCVVEGSRHFECHGDGMMRYQGCQITVMESGGDSAWKALEAKARAQPRERARIADSDVLVVADGAPIGWTFFLAHPRPNVLVCATDRGYLTELLGRVGKKAGASALPKDLPEWKQVDTSAPMWALRHFNKQRGPSDFTSPFFPFPEGDDRADKAAVGVVFQYKESEKGPIATLRYLSDAPDLIGLARRRWTKPSHDLQPRVRLVQPGVVEVQAPLTSSNASLTFAINVMWILGHGLII